MVSINPAQEILEQLKKEYIDELPSKIEEIETLVIGLDKQDNYEEIYRLVHSLKGSGGTYGLQIITVICHQLESYMESQFEAGEINEKHCIDHCLKYLDLLVKTQREASKRNEKFNNIEKLLSNLSNSNLSNKFSALVLESSKMQMNLIKQSLSSVPVLIDFNNNGLVALELLLHKKYDIVITGMELGELNGEALISAIRLSKSINKDVKAILLTTKSIDNPNRRTDPNKIILRSTSQSEELLAAVNELLKV